VNDDIENDENEADSDEDSGVLKNSNDGQGMAA